MLVQLIRNGGPGSPAYIIGFYLSLWLRQGFLAISAFLGALGSFFSGSSGWFAGWGFRVFCGLGCVCCPLGSFFSGSSGWVAGPACGLGCVCVLGCPLGAGLGAGCRALPLHLESCRVPWVTWLVLSVELCMVATE